MRAFGIAKVLSFYAVLLVVAGVALRFTPELGVLPPGGLRGIGGSLLVGLGGGALLVILSRLLVRYTGWAARLAQEFRSLLGELSGRQALLVALLSGVAEEALFRGVLMPSLGLWLSTLVFGGLHVGPNRHFWPWTLMACVAGLIFGAMALWTHGLIAPMVAHALVNFLNLRYVAGETEQLEVHLEPVGGESAVGSQ